jgi:hypothetical protein
MGTSEEYAQAEVAIKAYIEEKEVWMIKSEIERIIAHLYGFLRWYKIKTDVELKEL